MLTGYQNFNGGAQASMDDIWGFMSQALSFVDSTSWMAGACPFGMYTNIVKNSSCLTHSFVSGVMTDLQGVNTLNSLLGSDLNPTDLGYFVINNGN